MKVIDITGLNKGDLVDVARHLGLQKDWARVNVQTIRSMIQQFEYDAQRDALLQAGFSEEDLDQATSESNGETAVTIEVLNADNIPAVPAAKEDDAPPKASAQPDVAKVAALLAQLMASGAVNEERVGEIIDAKIGTLKSSVADAIESAIAKMPARKLEVTVNDRPPVMLDRQHKQFEQLLSTLSALPGALCNIWLAGPAGSGKTTAAISASKALSLPFYANGSIATKYELIGFIDAGGTYQRTPFRDAWEKGGVYLFDEIDGSDARALVSFNAALSNGVMAFPDGMIERHADCKIVAAANTFGLGATAEYVGRTTLDKATLDRFTQIFWEVDEDLERDLSGNESWASYVQAVRRRAKEKGLKVLVTPRATIKGAALIAAGVPHSNVVQMVLKAGMSDEQWKMVA